jgi:hypothetical protein
MEHPFAQRDWSRFWLDSEYAVEAYESEPLTEELLASIEQELDYKLPAAYVAMMRVRNGGIPHDSCFPIDHVTGDEDDYISITGVLGIGRNKPYALCGEFVNPFMIEECGYPPIGVMICDCPSAGHDIIMLDYRACGPTGEAAVVHVDQEADYRITELAPNFAAFIEGLVNEEEYDTSEENKLYDMRKVAFAPFSPLLASLCAHVTEVEDMEGAIRTIAYELVEDKGFFAMHADARSMWMYDIQFWLYTKTYPETTASQYEEVYRTIIVFAKGFSTGGFAPAFITDWLAARLQEGTIVETASGALRMTDEAAQQLVARLQAVSVRSFDDIPPEEDDEEYDG